MATIAEENKKILRQAMDVVVGVECLFGEMPAYEVSGYYPGSSGIINADPENITLMDLSSGGFLNDGRAEPLSTDTPGYLSVIGEPMKIRLTAPAGINYASIVYIVDGEYKALYAARYSSSATLTVPASQKRKRVVRLAPGASWFFNKKTLVECNLQLRAVDTTPINPELQLSEIEFSVKEDAITPFVYRRIDKTLGVISSGTIFYTAGYPGDMSPTRKFYLADIPEISDGRVTFRGEDASRLLSESFGGAYVGRAYDAYGGGVRRYVEMIHNMLNSAGVEHEYANFPNVEPFNNGAPFFVSNEMTKRGVIAQAVNMLRFDDDEWFSAIVNYVDAGRPRLWVGRKKEIKTLTNIARPSVSVDPMLKTVKFNTLDAGADSDLDTIETVKVNGVHFGTTSEPYYSFSTSSGTIERLNPYTYKITARGTVTVTGHKILLSGDEDTQPYIYNDDYLLTGDTVTLPDFNSIATVAAVDPDDGVSVWHYHHRAAENLCDRQNILYTFDYRGDPNLQPRDYIRADVRGNGSLTDMTIDHIEIRHENGGMISTITAREGFI